MFWEQDNIVRCTIKNSSNKTCFLDLNLYIYFSVHILAAPAGFVSVREAERLYVLDKWLHPWSFCLDCTLILFILTVRLRQLWTEMINTETFWSYITHDALHFSPCVSEHSGQCDRQWPAISDPWCRSASHQGTAALNLRPYSARCMLFILRRKKCICLHSSN